MLNIQCNTADVWTNRIAKNAVHHVCAWGALVYYCLHALQTAGTSSVTGRFHGILKPENVIQPTQGCVLQKDVIRCEYVPLFSCCSLGYLAARWQVCMTRARVRLTFTLRMYDARRHPLSPSSFLREIPPSFLDWYASCICTYAIIQHIPCSYISWECYDVSHQQTCLCD